MEYRIYGVALHLRHARFNVVSAFIAAFFKNLTPPFVAQATGVLDDNGNCVVKFPNGEIVALAWLNYDTLDFNQI